MKAVIGLLLMLVRVSLGNFCDGRQDKAQCYGALGGTVDIQLTGKLPENQKFTWLDPNNCAVKWTSEGPEDTPSERLEFISSNGTVRMNNLTRADDGKYTAQIHNTEGQSIAKWTLQLNIQAPVSSVQLKPKCLSQGVKKMFCSSEGDSPQFSWTLNGDPLTDDQLLSANNEANEITLNLTVYGELVCTVRNHISEASGKEMIPACGYIFVKCQLSNGTNITQWVSEANNTLCNQPATAATIATPPITSDNVGKKSDITVSNNPSTIFTSSNQTPSIHPWYFQTQYLIITGSVLFLLLFVLMVTVSLFCVHKRRESSKTQGGNDQQQHYADVELMQRLGRDVQPQAETGGYGEIRFSDRNAKPITDRGGAQDGEQVEYGQIKFAERPQQKNRRLGPDGAPQESEQVEYGQIKFAERPQQKTRPMGHNGAPQRSEEVEYGQIKFK